MESKGPGVSTRKGRLDAFEFRCVVFLLAACLLTWRQNVSSSVKGSVTGSSGAAVAGATCALMNEATGQKAAAPTQSDGVRILRRAIERAGSL